MKTRTLIPILILILTVLIITSSCATTSKTKVISRSEQLSSDKAYLADVFDYVNAYSVIGHSYNPNSPVLRLRSDNKEWVSMEFPSGYSGTKKPSGIILVVVEVEPGEYTVKDIRIFEGYFARDIMGIPSKLKDKIAVEPGSITYLGDFSIVRRSSLLGVSFESKYYYDFDGFQNRLKREYNVPENIELRSQ